MLNNQKLMEMIEIELVNGMYFISNKLNWMFFGFIENEEDSIKFNKLIGKDCE